MTMPCPYGYFSDLENGPYEKLIKERDALISEIRYFEKHKDEIMKSDEAQICPSPDTIYWWNLIALGDLCLRMSKRLEKIDNKDL